MDCKAGHIYNNLASGPLETQHWQTLVIDGLAIVLRCTVVEGSILPSTLSSRTAIQKTGQKGMKTKRGSQFVL